MRNARQIFVDRGLEGLRSALKNGAVLPAIAAAVLSPLALKDSDRTGSGNLLNGI